MQSRWNSFRQAGAGFNPAISPLVPVSAIDQARTHELADQRVLTGATNANVRAESTAFINALRRFLDARRELDEERVAYHRFDTLFNAADVRKLITAISHASFTTADVKALVDQETGDLTNISVAGISGKQGGIQTDIPNPGSFVGLGQHDPAARSEAIQWAATKGVTIPGTPDPRTLPAESIKLTAAYIGRSMDMLHPGLPAPAPTGDELKKLLFASYNGGAKNVKKAARSFQAGTSRGYTWNDIKDQPTITGQMRNYVVEIVQRIS